MREPVGFIWVWIFNFYICIITLVLVNVWLGRYQAWPAANLWGVFATGASARHVLHSHCRYFTLCSTRSCCMLEVSVAVLFLFFLVVVVLLRAL